MWYWFEVVSPSPNLYCMLKTVSTQSFPHFYTSQEIKVQEKSICIWYTFDLPSTWSVAVSKFMSGGTKTTQLIKEKYIGSVVRSVSMLSSPSLLYCTVSHTVEPIYCLIVSDAFFDQGHVMLAPLWLLTWGPICHWLDWLMSSAEQLVQGFSAM